MNDPHFDHTFLEYVLKGFLNHPEDIVIVRSVDEQGVLLRVTVHPDDMGKAIGRDGTMIDKVLRPLMNAVGMKHNARVSLKLDEPVGGKKSQTDETKSLSRTVDDVLAHFKL